MDRVVVVGSSGSGKTTVARGLAERLGVHCVELDALHHKPNWTEATADELREAVARELEGRERWVVDGNYYGKLGDFVLRQADTLVWLDLPLRTCLARLSTRTTRRIRTSEKLWNGNRETWRGAFWVASRSSGGRSGTTDRVGVAGRSALHRCRTSGLFGCAHRPK